MSVFDFHVHETLKLHLLYNIFQISSFKSSLEYVTREDTYHNKNLKQEPMLQYFIDF